MAIQAVKQKEGQGDAWQLGERDLFMIFDGQRARPEEVTAAFVDTRSKAAQDEDVEPGGSKQSRFKRSKRSARIHTRKLLLAYTEETLAARRQRLKPLFMGINQLETVFCVTSTPQVVPAHRVNAFHGKGTTLGPGLSRPPPVRAMATACPAGRKQALA